MISRAASPSGRRPGESLTGIRAESSDPALDRIARVLATPMSRRRVIRLAAAAAGASFFTLPSRAHAQAADDPCPTCADGPGTMPCCRAPRRLACKGGRRPVLRPQDRGVLLWARPVRRPADGLDLLGGNHVRGLRWSAGDRCAAAPAARRTRTATWRTRFRPTRTSAPRNARRVGPTVQVRNRGSVHKQASAVPHFKTAAGTAVAAGTAARRRVARRGAATTPISAVTSLGFCGCPQSQRCGSLCCEAGAVCCRASVAGELAGRRVRHGHYTAALRGSKRNCATHSRSSCTSSRCRCGARLRAHPAKRARQPQREPPPRTAPRTRSSLSRLSRAWVRWSGCRSPALGPARFPLSAPGQGRQARGRASQPGPGLDAAGRAGAQQAAGRSRGTCLVAPERSAAAYARSLGAIRGERREGGAQPGALIRTVRGQSGQSAAPLPRLRRAAAAGSSRAARRR